jgi:hypothetical protein
MTNPATEKKNVMWINDGRICYSLSVASADVDREVARLTALGFKPWTECVPFPSYDAVLKGSN